MHSSLPSAGKFESKFDQSKSSFDICSYVTADSVHAVYTESARRSSERGHGLCVQLASV